MATKENVPACPIRVVSSPLDTPPLYPAGDGMPPEQDIAGEVGSWGTCTVYVDVPYTWLESGGEASASVELRLYAITQGIRCLAAECTLRDAGLDVYAGSTRARGACLSAQGFLAEGWVLTATNIRIELDPGAVTLIMSGAGEVEQDGHGNRPGRGFDDRRIPRRAATVMAYDPDDDRWLPVYIDTTRNALIVAGTGGGGAFIVEGAQTPGDNVATPSDCVDTRAFIQTYDGANWDMLRSQTYVNPIPDGSVPQMVAVAAYVYGNDGAGNARRIRVSGATGDTLVNVQDPLSFFVDNSAFAGGQGLSAAALAFHRNQAGNWYLTRGGYYDTIPAAAVPAIVNSLASGGFRNARLALTNGEAAAHQLNDRGALLTTPARLNTTDVRDAVLYLEEDAVTQHTFAAVAAWVYNVGAINGTAGVLYLQLHNSAGAIVLGALPDRVWLLPAGSDLERDYSRFPIMMSVGATLAISTTKDSFTAPGAAADLSLRIGV